MSVIHIFSKTDVGIKRDQNEDSIRTIHVRRGGLQGEMEYWALILADGMGGYDKGEVASTMLCDEFAKFSVEKLPAIFGSNKEGEELLEAFKEEVGETLTMINATIWDMTGEEKMGSTLVYIVIFDEKIYMAYCGDSRAYRIAGGGIEQISVDHSYVNALLENDAITKEEAENHPMKNVITKSVGTNEKVTADFKEFDVMENSFILMCSDGLTDMVRDEGIGDIVLKNNPPTICQKLVDAANENGGKDNISIILARITSGRTRRPVMRPI